MKSVNKGSIKAINPPAKITGGFSLLATVQNGSDRLWESAGPNPIHIAYHWLDEDMNMIVYDGKRTKLPGGGIPVGCTAEIEVHVMPPAKPGLHSLHLTMVEEGVAWFDSLGTFASQILNLRSVLPSISGDWSVDLRRRIEMTTSCTDCDSIPKHPDAGEVVEWQGQKIQVMHEGTKVLAGGYHGGWMEEIIEKLGGHHEPQEELAFHHLLQRLQRGAVMVELGSFWAYYSNWFLGAVPGSKAICIEPDENNLAVGRANAILNERHPVFHVGCIGRQDFEEVVFQRESDQREVRIPCFNWHSVAGLAGQAFVDLLHIDAQGAELPFLSSLPESGCASLLRFVVVSTHHASISGSSTTHRDCLLELIRRGAVILCEHTIGESHSGDGLIIASFISRDLKNPLPRITRNKPENSLFGIDPMPQPNIGSPFLSAGQLPAISFGTEEPILTQSNHGPIWVFPSDTAIGASLMGQGCFEEHMVAEVTAFLTERYEFIPKQFIDVGANIGSHSLYALRSGLFSSVVAFEADPVNYDLLVRNIRYNGFERQMRAFHFPVSNRAGVVTLERASDNLGDHRVRDAELQTTNDHYLESHRETISLVSETLDNLDAEYQLGIGHCSLLWIDTQGHEGHVFDGAKGLLARGDIRYVVVEFWPYGVERAGGKEKLWCFLSMCSAIYDLRVPNWEASEKIEIEHLSALYDELLSQGTAHSDLLCIV